VGGTYFCFHRKGPDLFFQCVRYSGVWFALIRSSIDQQ